MSPDDPDLPDPQEPPDPSGPDGDDVPPPMDGDDVPPPMDGDDVPPPMDGDDVADESAFEAFAHREFTESTPQPRRRRPDDDVPETPDAPAPVVTAQPAEPAPGGSVGPVLRIGAVVLVVAFLALLVVADRTIEPRRTTVAAGPPVQQAWFCPTTPGGPQIETEITVASLADRPVQAQVQFAPVVGDLPAPIALEVPRNGAAGVAASEVMPGPGGAIVTTPDAAVAVGVKTTRAPSGRASGAAVYTCTRTTAERWTVASGSTAKGQEQRLHILNPFRDDAVVKVSFGVRDGQDVGREAPPETQGFVIRAGRSIDIDVGQFVIRREAVSTELVAERGRVVVAQTNQPDNKDGLAALMATPDASRTWYVPGVRNSGGFGAAVSLWNPSEVSLVDVEASAQVEPEQQPVAVQQTQVQPVTRLDLDLRDLADGPATVSLGLRGDEPFVVDEYRTSSSGIASVRPAVQARKRWILPWTGDAVAEGSVEIQNPTSTQLTAVLHQLTPEGGDLVPLGDPIVVPPGNRVAVNAKERGATGGASALAVVLDGPGIVGQAFAASGDLASDTAHGLE